ncbi:pantoate--beta-alanine ligase [Pontiella agarivorans]|uniref:Pantothenate synthetase n=1 Tax=Pontiella agarivorans TaxID=3038953 RepID=A0ABU5MSI0_9BACT|nr:pantoate--beta-alanine ligase [Pontiella agarivorans]MDZ8117162.1 pantoate--beta-alanine ligase [Pontiella agarivorans]
MKIIESPREMQQTALELKRAGKTIGFVPTMGFLHEGHLSLIEAARSQCDVLVVSIFVNPAQFGPNEDLDAYPRDFERDESLCVEEGVDILFYPEGEGMYASDASCWVDETRLSVGLCGGSRPGHFRGVCTVVAKLFNLVQPDRAVFGEKDAQQLRVIERMVRDLNFPVKIIRGPIVREPDGLAMSSRNRYLNAEQRRQALCLKQALDLAESLVAEGDRSVESIRQQMRVLIGTVSGAEIDYIEFVDDVTMAPVEVIESETLVALAVKIGATRLIDNMVLNP